MSTAENKNSSKPINPYLDKQSAILWLQNKGIRVIDERVTYHRISFEFPERMTTEREISVIQTLGSIIYVSFKEKRIYINTGSNN